MEFIAFVLLCVFWVLFIGRTIMLASRGVKVFVLIKGKSLHERLVEMLFIPALPIWSLQVALTAFDVSPLPAPLFWDSNISGWVGIVLCILGLTLFVAALISFGSAWRVGIDEAHSDRLVTGGIFAWSRNPIFLFMNIYFFGTFLIFPNWFFLTFFVLVAIGIHRQILNEEKFLRKRFGAEYAKYEATVGRYLIRL